MKKLTAILLCFLLCACFVTACGSKQEETTIEETTAPDENVYGTWSEDYFDSGYAFNSDGTGEDTFWDLPFTYTTDAGKLTLTFEDEMWGVARYTYSVDGDTLTMKQDGSDEAYEYERQ